MKTYDDFELECASTIEAIGQELRHLTLSDVKDDPSTTDLMILSSRVARLYSDRLLRLYHHWLSEQLRE